MIHPIIEDWQYIPDTKNIFVVSDRGRIGEILHDGTCGILVDVNDYGLTDKAYKTIWFFNVKHYVHILVARAFIPNPDPDFLNQVDHIDGCSRHNCSTNLRWVDTTTNNRHRTWIKNTTFNQKTLRWEIQTKSLTIQ